MQFKTKVRPIAARMPYHQMGVLSGLAPSSFPLGQSPSCTYVSVVWSPSVASGKIRRMDLSHSLDRQTRIPIPQGRGSMGVIVTLTGDIGSGYSIQPALNFHDAEVARQWSVQSLHVDFHEFLYRPPAAGHFPQVTLPPLPHHCPAVQAPVGSP
jgi:hypothetical protein